MRDQLFLFSLSKYFSAVLADENLLDNHEGMAKQTLQLWYPHIYYLSRNQPLNMLRQTNTESLQRVHNAHVNFYGKTDKTLRQFHEAIRSNNVAAALQILAAENTDADRLNLVNARDCYGFSALHLAAVHGLDELYVQMSQLILRCNKPIGNSRVGWQQLSAPCLTAQYGRIDDINLEHAIGISGNETFIEHAITVILPNLIAYEQQRVTRDPSAVPQYTSDPACKNSFIRRIIVGAMMAGHQDIALELIKKYRDSATQDDEFIFKSACYYRCKKILDWLDANTEVYFFSQSNVEWIVKSENISYIQKYLEAIKRDYRGGYPSDKAIRTCNWQVISLVLTHEIDYFKNMKYVNDNIKLVHSVFGKLQEIDRILKTVVREEDVQSTFIKVAGMMDTLMQHLTEDDLEALRLIRAYISSVVLHDEQYTHEQQSIVARLASSIMSSNPELPLKLFNLSSNIPHKLWSDINILKIIQILDHTDRAWALERYQLTKAVLSKQAEEQYIELAGQPPVLNRWQELCDVCQESIDELNSTQGQQVDVVPLGAISI